MSAIHPSWSGLSGSLSNGAPTGDQVEEEGSLLLRRDVRGGQVEGAGSKKGGVPRVVLSDGGKLGVLQHLCVPVNPSEMTFVSP